MNTLSRIYQEVTLKEVYKIIDSLDIPLEQKEEYKSDASSLGNVLIEETNTKYLIIEEEI